jgi:hypothetical protein
MANELKKHLADCDVCGVGHDEEIHEATLSVHRWFHDQVTQYLFDPAELEAQVA